MSTATTRGPVPLDEPYYGATFPIAFVRFWRKYATFTGRASRSEYWWWALVGLLVGVVLEAIYIPSLLLRPRGGGFHLDSGIVVAAVLGLILFVATIVPTLALAWRRLHDANLSGAFWFLGLIPMVGWIAVLVLMLQPSNPAGARFDRATGHPGGAGQP
jgi:uncharacterized membrane protein YhaH (DUF805 family)